MRELTPPSSDTSDPADLSSICGEDSKKIKSSISDKCGDDADKALKFYANTCKSNGHSVGKDRPEFLMARGSIIGAFLG